MKKLYFLLLLFPLLGYSQIIINQNDMPESGDTIRISIADSLSAGNYKQKGANQIWDYSSLTVKAQYVDSFLTVSNTPTAYQTYFGQPAGNPVSNIARKTRNPEKIGDFQPTNVFDYYKSTTGEYNRVGLGLKLNGFDIIIQNQSPDRIYKFPLEYTDTDSTYAQFSGSITGLLFVTQESERVDTVEGYGKLYLPNDTLDVVKIKSVINTVDSVSLPLASINAKEVRPTVTQYTFLAKNKQAPVLEIITFMDNNIEVVRSITFQDKFNPNVVGISSASNDLTKSAIVYPNPSNNFISLASNAPSISFSIFDLNGNKISSGSLGLVKSINISNLPSGVYTILVKDNTSITVDTFVKE